MQIAASKIDPKNWISGKWRVEVVKTLRQRI